MKGGSRPISRVLSRTIIHLGIASPQPSSNLPGNTCGPQAARVHVPLFGLAPSGVCPATTVASCAVRSYRTISPLPAPQSIGGIFSVALSVGLLRPGVTWHSVLWSPDFPLPQCGSDHLANSRPHVSRFRSVTQAPARRLQVGYVAVPCSVNAN